MSGRIEPAAPNQAVSKDSPDVAIRPPGLLLSTLSAGTALDWLLPASMLPEMPAARLTGLPLLLAAILLMAASMRVLRKAGTVVECHLPVTALLTTGPYRYSRNPIYLALLGITLAIAMLADNPWLMALLPVQWLLLDRLVVRREERYLTAKFGGQYQDYCRQVRRWL